MTQVFEVTLVGREGKPYKVKLGESVMFSVTDSASTRMQVNENGVLKISIGNLSRSVRVVGPCFFNARVVSQLCLGKFDWHIADDNETRVHEARPHRKATCRTCKQFVVCPELAA